MDGQDLILTKLLETFEQLQQRLGRKPKRSYPSSSLKLRRDLADFSEKSRSGELDGKALRRKSGELFRRIIKLHPDVWRQ